MKETTLWAIIATFTLLSGFLLVMLGNGEQMIIGFGLVLVAGFSSGELDKSVESQQKRNTP